MDSAESQTPTFRRLPPFAAATYRWVVVGMLWFICFFNYADRLAIFSVFPLLEKQYHLSKAQLGVIGAAFTWVYAVASPVAGHVGDRYPRKWVILGGLYVWSLITGLTAHCTRYLQFVLVRGSEGLGEAFYFPASMALISDYHTPVTRSRAIGLHQTSIYAGTIGGSALAGWMAEKWGWQSPFWTLALAGIVLGLALHLFIAEPRRNDAERREAEGQGEQGRRKRAEEREERAEPWGKKGDRGKGHEGDDKQEPGAGMDAGEPEHVPMGLFLAEFARTPTAMLLVAAYFGANLVGFVFLTWMPTFLKEKFGLNLAEAGLGATFFIQVASMVGAVLGGIAADRRVRRCAEGRIQVQAIAILLGAPAIFFCGYTRSLWWLVAAMTLYGLCKGVYDASLTAGFYDVIRPARRSTATGLMNFVGWLGAGLGAVAVGVAVDHHITMSVAISSTTLIFLGVAALLSLAAVTIRHSTSPPPLSWPLVPR